jgi:hypothetical protein
MIIYDPGCKSQESNSQLGIYNLCCFCFKRVYILMFQNYVDTSTTDLISLRADQAFVALTPSLANGQGIVADWIVAKGGPGGPQFFFGLVIT